ncbi:translation initiation factor eIF-2B delta subunit [Martensiomyces pterosporus]|nr:translation initiation factor eIF-2B delta subunit [Martensiomyces pterosporus]
MARDAYVVAETGEPATVTIAGAGGAPIEATLRDAAPPYASGPGQRRFTKLTNQSAGITIHPRIKEVGLRMATMEIAGANARAASMLAAFIDVIADYTTPPQTSLYRNLMVYLSPQINFLVHQRPMCVGMGNAIRFLKDEVVRIPADMDEATAKSMLTARIRDYMKERITAAGDVIAEAGAQKIKDGDVILTFGASSTVQRLLIAAHKAGRRFRVIVIDSRPQFEGRKLGRGRNGSNGGVTYAPIIALGFLMREASKVFLGAEAFFANGAMLSRAGTAMVALAAQSYHVPVIVACETYKFSERVQLDAVVGNELGTPDALMYKAGNPDAEPCPLNDWRTTRNLRLVNLAQDITPPDFVSVIITEVGMIPTTSIPVVLREYKNQI